MGKAGRVRLKGSKGGKRWKRGQSGSSNPQTDVHRNAAKGKFGNHLSQATTTGGGEGGSLTVDILASHDAVQTDDTAHQLLGEEEETREESLASSSAYSLIETSNPIFGRVKRLWNSPLETHREVCAVLAAVSEVIKEKNGTESATEYFAALLTALEATDEEKAATAVIFLLSIVMEKLPAAVLQSQFGSISKALIDALTQHESSDSTSLLRSIVSCLVTLLSAQPSHVWSDSFAQTILQTLFNFTTHPKPRLRKFAQAGLAGIIREGGEGDASNDIKFHPCCSYVAKSCKLILEGEKVETSTLHVLGLLRECLANFPTQNVKSLSEALLRLITLGRTVVKATGFQCLNGVFTSTAGPQGLTSQLNEQLISALYEHRPSIVDVQLMMAWTTVMESAHLRLLRFDRSLCFGHLVKFFRVCVNYLLSDSKTIHNHAAGVMKNMLQELVPLALPAIRESKENEKALLEYTTLVSVFKMLEGALSFKYQSAWEHVLGVLETFYCLAGKDCHKFMTKSLKSFSELRNIPKFAFVSQLESAFGAAVKSMGPKIVLTTVPLKLDVMGDPPDFPQSWMVPLLQEYVQSAELSYYVKELLPLAGVMRGLAEDSNKSGKDLQAKLYNTLEYQIWQLLTAFCNSPTDIAQSFPSIARVLGTALSEKVEVRNIVCNSLKTLIETSKETESDSKVLGQFSKNFLPILFNLYTNEDSKDSSVHILEAIKAYLSITNRKLLQTLFSRIIARLGEPDLSSDIRICLEDIVEGFVPFLNESSLKELYDFISATLDSDNSTYQKKAYKLLAALLSCSSPQHSSFVSDNLPQLQTLLLGSLSTAGIGSKKPRLRCLLSIVPHLTTDHHDFVLAVVPEAILCTKEANDKCRQLSYQLLSVLGRSSQQLFMLSPEESVKEYFNVVLAGLAGTSHMISATIGSLARLVYEFSDLLGSGLVETLLSSVTEFFSAKSREVVRSALIFIKVSIGILPHAELAPYVKELVEKVLSWSANDKNHFRMKSRVILERLIRKFNLEMISGFVPKQHRRLISNIKKTNERQKRKQRERRDEKMAALKEDYDSSSTTKKSSKPSFEELMYDSDDEEIKKGSQTKTKRGRESGGTWIKEDRDKPLDFLDSTAGQHLLGTNPSKKKSVGASLNSFKYSSDGKLVITEDDESQVQEDITDTEPPNVLSRKRKRGNDNDNDSDDQEDGRGLSRGTGIRRHDPTIEIGAKPTPSKKLKGDVKKKNQLEPYSYLQLDRQNLNKRKKAKLSGQFKGIMKKAQRGSTLGRKQRRKKIT
ncbi:PREDICTED: RRP12-like protein [Amphimedon queenslandica]|uniref:Uncharacterized protein n=1 Tax=Amphimedon queenslandica TaxID=400682 RepID=A0A1X7VNI6_AMPQE|nr:PREDICTED: RRP12-like protein [Amphimedon queenslandica]|eukprot:XP_019858475.1 PREDICTED: RRP12-like protein [Amphimedon queenslandica]